jgi:hypothetical protein
MSVACTYPGCTVAETGKCALERPTSACEYFLASSLAARQQSVVDGAQELGTPVLEQPQTTSSFPSSRTLSQSAMDSIVATRYVTTVGILGDPESGKTACLASLYLLVASAQLTGWAFADSKSLMGFEDISRGARDWNAGTPPEQMTMHTEMSDDRQPGFLHLRLRRLADGRTTDLALPDLPGEWTTALVETARSDRFEFLRSADVIWMVVDGRALSDRERRNSAISRLGQLVSRLQTLCETKLPKLILVLTRRDAGMIEGSVLARIHSELARRNASARIIEVASFSDNVEVRPGHGMASLIDATLASNAASFQFWPSTDPSPTARAYLRFRRKI